MFEGRGGDDLLARRGWDLVDGGSFYLVMNWRELFSSVVRSVSDAT